MMRPSLCNGIVYEFQQSLVHVRLLVQENKGFIKQSEGRRLEGRVVTQRIGRLIVKNPQRGSQSTAETLPCLPATVNMPAVMGKLSTKTPKGNMRGLMPHNLITIPSRYANVIAQVSSMRG